MNNLTPNNAPTFESVWALMQENAKQQKENERIFKEQIAEYDRRQKEQIAEYDRQQKEQNAEYDRRQAEYDRQQAETDRQLKENWNKYEKRMKRMEKDMGSWSNNQGSFAEEYFYNAFDEGQQNFFGEHFDEIEQNLKPKSLRVNNMKIQDEYDIVLYNHSSVAIIEVKFKAHENDVAKTLKKAETFRVLCPDYKDYKIYLGLASMSFYSELEEKCNEQGIAIIKQVGDMVVINDEHLKVF